MKAETTLPAPHPGMKNPAEVIPDALARLNVPTRQIAGAKEWCPSQILPSLI
jgi:hypothetical protein